MTSVEGMEGGLLLTPRAGDSGFFLGSEGFSNGAENEGADGAISLVVVGGNGVLSGAVNRLSTGSTGFFIPLSADGAGRAGADGSTPFPFGA